MSLFKKKQAPATAPSPAPPAQSAAPAAERAPRPAAGQLAQPPRRLISYRIGNLQGVGSRERQEDSFAFVNAMDVTEMRRSGLLAVVADGMGGMRDGKVASEAVIASLREDFLKRLDRGGDIAGQLCDSVLRAGERVFHTLDGDGGSTVVACMFYEEQLWFASVGDSFLWLLRDGELLRLNREHNVMTERWAETIRRGGMDPEPGREDPEKAALTQFLGMDLVDDVDFLRRPMKLHDGDVLLLCSDGVGGVLTEETVRACLSNGVPEEMCAALERAVMLANNPYQDNFTALVIQCGI